MGMEQTDRQIVALHNATHGLSCLVGRGIINTDRLYLRQKKVKNTDTAVRSLTCHTATGTHMPYRITQCYLPPDTGDIPAFTPAKAGTRLSGPGGMHA